MSNDMGQMGISTFMLFAQTRCHSSAAPFVYRSQRILSHGMHRSDITSVYGPDAPPGPNMINNVSEILAPNVSRINIHVVC